MLTKVAALLVLVAAASLALPDGFLKLNPSLHKAGAKSAMSCPVTGCGHTFGENGICKTECNQTEGVFMNDTTSCGACSCCVPVGMSLCFGTCGQNMGENGTCRAECLSTEGIFMNDTTTCGSTCHCCVNARA